MDFIPSEMIYFASCTLFAQLNFSSDHTFWIQEHAENNEGLCLGKHKFDRTLFRFTSVNAMN